MSIDKNPLATLEGVDLGLTRIGHLVSRRRVLAENPLFPGAQSLLSDHFNGVSRNTFLWGSHLGSDGAAVGPAITVAKGGRMRLTTGAGAGGTMAVNGSQIDSELNWEPDAGGMRFATRLKLSAITNIVVFAGFTNQKAALQMPATLGAGNAMTVVANDFVGFLFDTSSDSDTIYMAGAKAGTGQLLDSKLAYVAATDMSMTVEIDVNGNAQFYMGGKLVGSIAGLTTKTVPMTPVVAAFTRTAASANVDIDHIYCAQDLV